MKSIFKGLKELISGLGITGKHLGRHAITIQYPEERWDMPERSRGIVVLLSDKETGELNCTSCMLCMRACPTAAITIDAPRGEDKRRVLKKFDIDITLCCFCGLCEEACNFSAIKMAPKYEFSVRNKDELLWDMNKLQEVGLDVPYEDTRKKRPVKKPASPANPVPAKAEINPEAPASQPAINPGTEEKKADTENNEGGT